MVHDHLGEAVRSQTTRASAMLIATMLGGVLVFNSFLAKWIFGDLFYRDAMALVGALLLGLPLVWQSIKHLYAGHMHMDELAALAIVAAFAVQEYQTAGVVAFFMIVSNLIETRTALGARASIESLIRLTPTVAEDLRLFSTVLADEIAHVLDNTQHRDFHLFEHGDTLADIRQGHILRRGDNHHTGQGEGLG